MRGHVEQIDGLPGTVDKSSTLQILEAEPEMIANLLPSQLLPIKYDLRHRKQILDTGRCIWRILRALQKIKKSKT
jgi:hypothetical protein